MPPRFTRAQAAREFDQLILAGLEPSEIRRRLDLRLADAWERLVAEGVDPNEATKQIESPTEAESKLMPPIERAIWRGLGKVGTAAVSGIEFVTGRNQSTTQDLRKEQRAAFGVAESTGEKVAEVGAQIVGEVGLAAAPTGAALKLARAPQAVSKGARAARFAAAEAPISGALEVGQAPGESISELVGAGGSPLAKFGVGAGIGAGAGAVVGLLTGAKAVTKILPRPVRQTAEAVVEEVDKLPLKLDVQPPPSGSLWKSLQSMSEGTKRYARAIYTSAPATAIRNYFAGIGRLALSPLEDAGGEFYSQFFKKGGNTSIAGRG